jgi:calreticulin
VSAKRENLGKFDVKEGGLKTTEDAKFYGISSEISTTLNTKGKTFVIQFVVRHPQSIDCGGGYLKLVKDAIKQEDFKGDSEYGIMFGPDICGSTRKVHLIFNHNGKNLDCKKNIDCLTDKLSHVYTAIINPDDTYEVLIDGEKKESGKLSEDWTFTEPKLIPDANAKKPEDWVDEAEILDETDKKPENWDNIPKTIVDPEAKKPEDWNEEEDGKWEAPTISNPEYKGEWVQKKFQIQNIKVNG